MFHGCTITNKQKDPSKEPWYQIYTLNDFKKMQKEVRLNRGTLGPDTDWYGGYLGIWIWRQI
jgi:hypothetical protein